MILNILILLVACASSSFADLTQADCKKNEVLVMTNGYCEQPDNCNTIVNGVVYGCPKPPDDENSPFYKTFYEYHPTCRCKKGFARINEECVPVQNCCEDPNQIAVPCPSSCDRTCSGIDPTCSTLTPCHEYGCKCKKNYVKENGECIHIRECEPWTEKKPTDPMII